MTLNKKLKITDNDNCFYIENLDLEIKLNLSSKYLKYDHLGNHIYNYFARYNMIGQSSNVLIVTKSEYIYLNELNKKNLKDVI